MCNRSAATTPKIERRLLRHLAFEALLGMILRGEIEPGTRLNDEDLIAELGISRTPIREALTKLSLHGLVDVDPNRRTTVTPLCKRDVLDDLQVLSALYPIAVSEVIRNVRATDLITREAALPESIKQDTHWLEMAAYSADFVYEHTQNASLAECIRGKEFRLIRYLHLYPNISNQRWAHVELLELMSFLSTGDIRAIQKIGQILEKIQKDITQEPDQRHGDHERHAGGAAPRLRASLSRGATRLYRKPRKPDSFH